MKNSRIIDRIKSSTVEKCTKRDTGINLKRSIGLSTAVSVLVGGMIGSAIFISPQHVTVAAGSYGLSLIVWALCGVIAMCGALVYAEIGTLIPKSGSTYYLLREVYGDLVSFLYMFVWTVLLLPGGLTILALTCSDYVMVIFFSDGCGAAPESTRKVLATALLLFVAMVNTQSVQASSRMAVVCTVGKVLALTLIILGGIVKLSQGYSNYLDPSNSFTNTSTDVGHVAMAFIYALLAFEGWDRLNFVTEELEDPFRNLPHAIMISVAMVSGIYIFVNASYFVVLSPEEFTKSSAPAMSWAAHVIPRVTWFMPLSIALSTFGACSSFMLLNSRLGYVSGREGHNLQVIGMLQIKYLTPTPSVVFSTFLSIIFMYLRNMLYFIGLTGVLGWFFQGLVAIGVIIVRHTRKDTWRPYKVPLVCPVVLLLASVMMTLGPIIDEPTIGYLFPVIVLIAGVLRWLLFAKYQVRLPGFGKVTTALQLLMQVIPPESEINIVKKDSICMLKNRTTVRPMQDY